MTRGILRLGVAWFPVWLFAGLVPGCDGPTEPGTGNIEVASSTSGQPVDADGYAVVVDQGDQRVIAANATLTISDVPAGDHEIQILGIAPNCSLDGANPRTVSVTRDGLAQVTFAVGCSALTGGIEVTTTTSGVSADSDGYSIALDGQAGHSIASSDTLTLPGVAAGTHALQITGVEPNCVVVGDNPRTLQVGTDIVRTTFEITCGAPTGAIAVSTVTAGIFLDSDGYAFTLDAGNGQPIGSNESVTLAGLPVGNHLVQLTGIAPNCDVAGDNPQTVSVGNGSTADARFQLNCVGAGASSILFASDRTGTSHLYRVQDDGSGLVDLTPSVEAYDGDWSPDGTRIVVNTASGIQIRNANGSNPIPLGAEGSTPRWSPDGSWIVFEGADTVQLIKADGSQRQKLARGFRPDWSPDGSQIVFDRIDDQVCFAFDCFPIFGLYVMKSDGSQIRLLATTAECGVWAPDGRSIAYIATFDGLYVVNADGTGNRRIVSGGVGCPVIWSPDGSAIAYPVGQSDGTSEMMVSPSTGGPGVALASSPGSEFPESWR